MERRTSHGNEYHSTPSRVSCDTRTDLPGVPRRGRHGEGFTGKVHHMDAKVGGTFKMSFTNFTSGKSHSFGGQYLELMPHERIRYTDNFDDPNLPGEIRVTVTLKKVSCGTEVNIVQE